MDLLNIILSKILVYIYEPIVSFLKHKDLWKYIVKLYEILYGPISKALLWISEHVGVKTIIKYLIEFIRLVIDIFITLFHVIVNIYTWIVGLIR